MKDNPENRAALPYIENLYAKQEKLNARIVHASQQNATLQHLLTACDKEKWLASLKESTPEIDEKLAIIRKEYEMTEYKQKVLGNKIRQYENKCAIITWVPSAGKSMWRKIKDGMGKRTIYICKQPYYTRQLPTLRKMWKQYRELGHRFGTLNLKYTKLQQQAHAIDQQALQPPITEDRESMSALNLEANRLRAYISAIKYQSQTIDNEVDNMESVYGMVYGRRSAYPNYLHIEGSSTDEEDGFGAFLPDTPRNRAALPRINRLWKKMDALDILRKEVENKLSTLLFNKVAPLVNS
jgi:hypothetical protein